MLLAVYGPVNAKGDDDASERLPPREAFRCRYVARQLSIKTRYRRISGRKNWNRYLLRYGRRVAYYEAGVRMTGAPSAIEACARRVPHDRWRKARREQRRCQEEQLKQYRVRHRRQQFLAGLEARWAETTHCTGLLP